MLERLLELVAAGAVPSTRQGPVKGWRCGYQAEAAPMVDGIRVCLFRGGRIRVWRRELIGVTTADGGRSSGVRVTGWA